MPGALQVHHTAQNPVHVKWSWEGGHNHFCADIQEGSWQLCCRWLKLPVGTGEGPGLVENQEQEVHEAFG